MFKTEFTMDSIISITDKALEQIEAIAKTENPDGSKGLRLAVIGGGCSGLSYKIAFSDSKDKDNVLQFGSVQVFIDPKSVIYLKGIILDYKDGLNGKGFVFDNPNAKNTCGCGESFSL
jgi:iron-sulfur cluster assembly protein